MQRPNLDEPPKGYFIVVPPATDEQAIDLAGLFRILWQARWVLVLAGLASGAVAAVVTLRMPNIYRAEALLAPVTQNEGVSANSILGGEFGGLAALAGIDIGGGGRKEENLAVLASPSLARDFIVSQDLMPILFEDDWDAAARAWRNPQRPPTLEDGLRLFATSVRLISEDRRTGLVTVRFEWRDRELAAQWANAYVAMANEGLRNEAIENAQSSIEFLNRELEKSSVVELQQAIYRLIEGQVRNAMLANVQLEYAFRVLDAAVAPDAKSKVKPRRSLITLVVSFAAVLLATMVILMLRRREWLGTARSEVAAPSR